MKCKNENWQKIINEVKLYKERMKRWPSISQISFIMDEDRNATAGMIKRMVRDGYLAYYGEWRNGQSRKVKSR